jgi:hypothetical protein
MCLKRDKRGNAVDRPSWESSLLGDPGAKFSVENRGQAQTKRKWEKRKKRRPVETDGSHRADGGIKSKLVSGSDPPQEG